MASDEEHQRVLLSKDHDFASPFNFFTRCFRTGALTVAGCMMLTGIATLALQRNNGRLNVSSKVADSVLGLNVAPTFLGDSPLGLGLAGVNVGGWLCLEDWFFSGEAAGMSVMTEGTDGQGACFPPAVAALNAPWPSEGNLTQRLVTLKGKDFAAKAFEAHRHQFITEDDLSAMASLGLQVIRLPLTWAAFADALVPLDAVAYGSHNPEVDTWIVPDPFYNETSMFATVPRAWLAGFLRRAAAHGLQVLIDLHAFPGGSAQGTYNGIWPQDPVFWNKTARVGNGSIPLKEIGLWITQALVEWVEGLDKEAQDAVVGVTMMNEPAHMAAFVHFAEETDVLNWLAASADQFRSSTLPALGKKLYVQVIGTAFKDFDGTVLPWFFDLFTQEDRSTWAVMDQHWYTAWDNGGCDGKLSADGGFRCDDPIENITRKLRSCAGNFASGLHENYGSGLTAVTEFSVGTSEKARYACTDRHVLKVFFQEQIRAFNQFGIQPFFWTWRMPFGPVFEPGWSLRWLAGLEEPKPSLPCLAPWALKENIVG